MKEIQESEISKRENAILIFWKENNIFEKSLKKPAPKGEFVFYDGPPFATGLPHYGHIVASVIKDAIPRYKTMRGYHVPRVWGWDCHGLPIENIVEKQLGFKHKKDIYEYGIEKFNERCRAEVTTYVKEWGNVISRTGRWVDMDNAYFTMSKTYMESVWWVFKQIYEKGLVYEDYRSMHICPRCETTLSQQEVSEGYKDVKDISVTAKFKVRNPEKLGLSGKVFLLAWTTTPWTLPGNVALAVGEDIEYQLIQDTRTSEIYILAKASNGLDIYKENKDFVILDKTFLGKGLAGLSYEPVFNYYSEDTDLENYDNGWKVYVADFVTTDTGTGIVHIAPAFGEDDMALGKKENLPFIQHVGMNGVFASQVTDFAGMNVKPHSDNDKDRLASDIAVLKYLQEHDRFFSKENITHQYPHCWRCDTPLLNYATTSWFVSVTKIKEDLLKDAESIKWSPTHIKNGRFGKWLEGARDWSISRQRFWASVIPVWRCDNCSNELVFGSVKELELASGSTITDLHKHVVDEITVPCVCGKEMHRVPDVLDTWFDSGSMPYGSQHYPFENKEDFEKTFPAQFIAEGIDQTRAWFYYLHVLSVAVFNKPAFQNVIVNGIMLAEDGKKMSKKLKNYPDPMEIIEKYGADALRFYLLSSPVVQAENLSFSEDGVDEVAKKNVSRLSNVLAFYKMYEDGTPREANSIHILDRWVLDRLSILLQEITIEYEKYELDKAVRPVTIFIDDLSVWYVRRSRNRFKKDCEDKKMALATLRYVLYTLATVIAPPMPFIAEEIFQSVREDSDAESVHLLDWPDVTFAKASQEDADTLIADMELVRELASEALRLRQKASIKVRQPLAVFYAPTIPKNLDLLALLRDEINVKEIKESTEVAKIDTRLTPELIKEGDEREMTSAVMQARKAEGLSLSDVAHTDLSQDGKYVVTLSTGDVKFNLIRDAT